MTDAKW